MHRAPGRRPGPWLRLSCLRRHRRLHGSHARTDTRTGPTIASRWIMTIRNLLTILRYDLRRAAVDGQPNVTYLRGVKPLSRPSAKCCGYRFPIAGRVEQTLEERVRCEPSV